MRTTLWYSQSSRDARAQPSHLLHRSSCTEGRLRLVLRDKKPELGGPEAKLSLERKLPRPLLRLPVVAGNLLDIKRQTVAQGRRRFPVPALMRQHQLKYRT